MKIVIEVSDEELKAAVLKTIAESRAVRYEEEIGIRDAVAAAVKELVYPEKEQIIERCVDRASREMVRKGIPRLLEKAGE